MDLSKSNGNRRSTPPEPSSLPDVVPQNPEGNPVSQPADGARPPAATTHAQRGPTTGSARREWRDSRRIGHNDVRFFHYRRHRAASKAARAAAAASRRAKAALAEEPVVRKRPRMALPPRGATWLTHRRQRALRPGPGDPLPIAQRGFLWLTGTPATAFVPVARSHRCMRPRREEATMRCSDGEDVSSDDPEDEEQAGPIVVSQEVEVTSHHFHSEAIQSQAIEIPPEVPLANEEILSPNDLEVNPQEVIIQENLEFHQVNDYRHEFEVQEQPIESHNILLPPPQDEPFDLSIKSK